MSRILQRGEIESLDHTEIPRIRLPQPDVLFAERAARLEVLAEGNPIADYLRFAAALVRAQQAVVADGLNVELPPRERIELAQANSMPLFSPTEALEPAWRTALVSLLDALERDEHAPQPPNYRTVADGLRAASAEALDELALSVLANHARDVASAPFVAAALQVTYAQQASQLLAKDVPYVDPHTICPVCGGLPVASIVRIGGQYQGYRYLHCCTCETEWHMVRVKCSHCGSTHGIGYEGVAGKGGEKDNEAVLAETCVDCGTYRKIVNQEKDVSVEPVADDLASITLDLLMSETRFTRASPNPLLPYAPLEGEPQDEAADERA